MNNALGIDVGATGIKGAIINLDTGDLTSERYKIATPKGGHPDDITKVITEMVAHFNWGGQPVGVGFPSVIMNGIALTASNIDKSWIGFPIDAHLSAAIGVDVKVVNDADAAGLAEMKFGRGIGVNGTVLLLTLGTGIGSAFFKDGLLLRNTELGQIKFKGKKAETLVANSARKRRGLSWEEYGQALGSYLKYINLLFYPDLIILGGGISKRFEEFSESFSELNVVPAMQLNNAGIVGAALTTLS